MPTASKRILEDLDISDNENYESVRAVQSSSSCKDKVPAKIIREYKTVIRDMVYFLFRKFVQLGFYLKVFKQAESIMIPKAKNRDLALPES